MKDTILSRASKRTYLILALLCFVSVKVNALDFLESNKDAAKKIAEDYFKDPKKDVLIYIESLGPSFFGDTGVMTINKSIVMPNVKDVSDSFEINAPYAFRFPSTELINMLPKPENTSEKEAIITQANLISPIFNFIAQTKDYRGIKGSIYFAGKEVASSKTTLEYGAITLSYNATLGEYVN